MPTTHYSANSGRRRSARLYSTEESARILEASRAALRQAHSRPRHPRRESRRESQGYYALPRPVASVIPPYEDFLAEARARVNHGNADRQEYGPRVYEQFRPDPYLYGYPSGYYTELRTPLSHNTSGRSGKSGRSSTLVGTESRRSSTVVDSNRTSLNRAPSSRDRYANQRSGHVHWGPNYVYAEPPAVSNHFPNSLPQLSPIPEQEEQSSVDGCSEAAAQEEEEELPDIPIRSVNVSPSLFIEHETYIITDSAVREHHARLEQESRAKQENLIQELSSAGASSKWSVDSEEAEERPPLAHLTRTLSAVRQGFSGRKPVPARRKSIH